MQGFSHLDEQGKAAMVDVSDKAVTARRAVATGRIHMHVDTLRAVKEQNLKKGDVLAVARIAGIQGAKKCSDLIPLCHPLALSKVDIQFRFEDSAIVVTCECKLKGQTGVEMEALTGVNVALLTIYDMCKALDKSMHFEGVTLLEKTGGRGDG
ncbi:cyclic pyranopterin monophosphate synthase MoaC [Alteromonas sediminis]|uniref:cyclic pyranopterin monophosphate synthase n=1 Tax=Alteromonas sediminis TaxID=2259342 RepID=A0A3N5Y0S1_9ALTE|nr:cyclic pyranopterin monophosphate synthase MoaC [Alteromonas sediminis]RPJ67082.1 cyclic pyranopterin monophosphate synthase MoaC [Alteromonas sediminis]